MAVIPLVEMTDDEHTALDEAQRAVRTVREWRRYQAVRLLADGREAGEVARVLGCSVSSVYYWAADWREQKAAGLAEGPHEGRSRRLDATAEALLEQVLAADPQAHGYAATDWTVPLLRTELDKQGYELSERTLRRTLHRLGYQWKRPKYVLGRPDPTYAAKKGRSSSK
jgi:transposase